MKTIKTIVVMSSVLLLSCGGESGSGEAVAESTCVTENLSFKADIWPIFEANCLPCHNSEDYARKADGNLFDGYASVKEKLDEGLIIGNIEHTSGFIKMPYKKTKIADCDIDKIKGWAKAGALDN